MGETAAAAGVVFEATATPSGDGVGEEEELSSQRKEGIDRGTHKFALPGNTFLPTLLGYSIMTLQASNTCMQSNTHALNRNHNKQFRLAVLFFPTLELSQIINQNPTALIVPPRKP